jgi:hypothetical protein
MQGTSSAVSLVGARLLSSVAAQIPSPPATTEFFFSSLVGLPEAHLLLEVDGVEVDVEFTSSTVAHVLQQITAAGFTAEFSNRFITISADPSVSYVKVLPYPTPAQDASILLGFPHGETFSAYSRPNWDSPAPGKNKETFIQQYENNLSSAVNRALSALSSNLEEHNRFLSDELAVPRFVNTEENSDVLGFVLDEGNFTALILRDRAYVGEDVTQSLASLEKFFVLTDKFGACSITTSDRDEPIRICDVVSGPPPETASPRTADYFDNLPGTSSFVSFGDGLSVVGVQEQNTEIGSYTATEITEGNKIRFDSEIVDLYPGCRLVWPAGSKNSGEYIVTSLVTDFVVEVRPTATGTDTLENLPTAGIVVYHSNIIKADAPFLYLIFDRPVPQEQVLHGFGLLYGSRTSVKDFLTTTLMGNLKGQAVSDIVIRSLRAIRGPNSANYRSTRVGDPDGYLGDVDSSKDGGDLLSLESLSSRSILGRDQFDLTGAGAIGSLINGAAYYSYTDGAKSVAHAPVPFTLFGNSSAQSPSPDNVGSAINSDSSKWINRLGGPGPFFGATLIAGRILEKESAFLPTDVGFTVTLAPDTTSFEDAEPEHKPLLRTWTIEKFLSPDRVLLSCVDMPELATIPANVAVQFTFKERSPRNLSAGALIRLDKISSDPDSAVAGAKVNALVLADHAGITGVVTLSRVLHTSVEFENKLVGVDDGAGRLVLSDLAFKGNYSLVHHLHPYDKEIPFTPSIVAGTERPSPFPDGPWTGPILGSSWLLTVTRRPSVGATVVEVVSTDGTFDGMFLLNSVKFDSTGHFLLSLKDFALGDVSVPAGTNATIRLYTLNHGAGLRAAVRGWGTLVDDSRAYYSFFGQGPTPDSDTSVEVATRFSGAGALDAVVEIRADGVSTTNQDYVPRTALSVWADSPSQGIEVNTSTTDTGDIADLAGGTGVRVISNTSSRALLTREEEAIKPLTAAIIASQLYDGEGGNVYTRDPLNRDPVAIFATQTKPSAPGDDEFRPDFADIEIIPSTYDTNAQVVSYVCDEVYQRSDDRARWSVFIYQDAQDAENSAFVQIHSDERGYLDYTVTLTEGASNSVTLNSPSKELRITVKAGDHYTASELVTAVNAVAGFSAVCSNTGAWSIDVANMPGSGSASAVEASFAPASIIQDNLNNAIRAVQGDIVVNDGIFAIVPQERLTGVGSDLIPVNPEIPLQPTTPDTEEATNPAVGYDLGEEEIIYGPIYTTFTVGTSRFTVPAFPVEESHINRKVTFSNGGPGDENPEVITRYITGIDGTEYVVDSPIVFSNWVPGVIVESGRITIYGRRWRNVYAQNIETTTLATEDFSAANITVEDITVTNELTSENIIVDSLRVTGIRRKFISANEFTTNLNTNEYLEFRHVKSNVPVPLSTVGAHHIGWILNVPTETSFSPATTAKLLYCWSPEIAIDTYVVDGHTPANPLRYEITGVIAHYRYLGDAELSALDIDGADRDYAMVSIRTHYYTVDTLTDLNMTWFAGGYAFPISAAEKSEYLVNDGFGDPAYPVAILQDASPGIFAGFFSFEVVLRPQLLFSGLTINYRKVAV